jgi:hypothetical protein
MNRKGDFPVTQSPVPAAEKPPIQFMVPTRVKNLRCPLSMNRGEPAMLWTAVAERSGDTAFERGYPRKRRALASSRNSPNGPGGVMALMREGETICGNLHGGLRALAHISRRAAGRRRPVAVATA